MDKPWGDIAIADVGGGDLTNYVFVSAQLNSSLMCCRKVAPDSSTAVCNYSV